MRTYIVLALSTSYAAAYNYASQAVCDGFFVGLIMTGWSCTFDGTPSVVNQCTKTGSNYNDIVCTDDNKCFGYKAACQKADGTYLAWAEPTKETCDAYIDF